MRTYDIMIRSCLTIQDHGTSYIYVLEAENEHDAVEAAMLNAYLDNPNHFHFWYIDVGLTDDPIVHRYWLTVMLYGGRNNSLLPTNYRRPWSIGRKFEAVPSRNK